MTDTSPYDDLAQRRADITTIELELGIRELVSGRRYVVLSPATAGRILEHLRQAADVLADELDNMERIHAGYPPAPIERRQLHPGAAAARAGAELAGLGELSVAGDLYAATLDGPSPDPCGADVAGFRCTRPAGHEGRHITTSGWAPAG